MAIEEPFDQDNWETWQKFTASAGILVVEDDFTVANPKQIAKVRSPATASCSK